MSGSPPNHQSRVIDCFEQLIDRCNASAAKKKSAVYGGNTFRERCFRHVVNDMRNHFGDDVQPLHSIEQLKGRKGYGKGTLKRISEIIETGTLEELNAHTSDNDDDDSPPLPFPSVPDGNNKQPKERTRTHQLRLELQNITGIGPVKAKNLVAAGISRQNLKEWFASDDQDNLKRASLTHHQLLGIKYDDDLQHRIPRHVIARFDTKLQELCNGTNKLKTNSPNPSSSHVLPSTATICGSYRRGNENSGDVDVLITDPSWSSPQQATDGLRHLLVEMHRAGLLVDDLTSHTNATTKYMGFLRVPKYKRAMRVDIRAVVRSQYAPALAYFTGSKDENVRLRRIAVTKNMRLNEYGLFANNTEHTPPKDCTPEYVPVHTEEELYSALGEPYVHPTNR